MGLGPLGLCNIHLPPIPRHQRFLTVNNGVHRGTLHSNLSSHEGPVHLHSPKSKEDYIRSLDIRLYLLQSLAVSHQNATNLLQRIRKYGNLYLRIIQESLRWLLPC
ncbi:hypothetical protein AVEN_275326-1 [Araneus ventricosus]|uniref:Uncharacterized protein n=1 Tax=Araneus ventricosus TaxID=182803 RepID=A0A4Y2J452_ARAVE|nr:hypothetical protein AVEN_275326-1 [Araneus ventricosus]